MSRVIKKVVNPCTGRTIRVGGAKYTELVNSGIRPIRPQPLTGRSRTAEAETTRVTKSKTAGFATTYAALATEAKSKKSAGAARPRTHKKTATKRRTLGSLAVGPNESVTHLSKRLQAAQSREKRLMRGPKPRPSAAFNNIGTYAFYRGQWHVNAPRGSGTHFWKLSDAPRGRDKNLIVFDERH